MIGKGIILAESRNKHSRIYRYAQCLVEEFENLEVIDPLTYNMLPCVGCKECFCKGICILDNHVDDRGAEVKRKLIETDIIIIISPVYAHNVSSDFKLLVDRISYWLHIFKLLGKPFIIITTTGTNGEDFVNNYINKIFTYLGACRIHCATFFETDSLEYEREKLNNVKSVIRDYINGKIEIKITQAQEEIFHAFQKLYRQCSSQNNEYRYWLENGFFAEDSLQNILQNLNEVKKNKSGGSKWERN